MKRYKEPTIKYIYFFAFTILFLSLSCPALVLADELVLTEQEQDYIDERNIIKAASIDGGAPLHFFNSKGEVSGIAVKILDEIAARTGLIFEYYLYDSINNVFNSDAEIYFGLSPEYATPNLVLSEPYLVSETILFYNSSLEASQLKDKKFAAIDGVTLPQGIEKQNTIFFDNREDTFKAVDSGKADYGYSNAYSLTFYTLQNDYKNIISIPTGKEERLYCIGFKNQDSELISIINKAIKSIDENELETLVLDVASKIEKKNTLPGFIDRYFIETLGLFLTIIVLLAFIICSIIRAKRKLETDIVIVREKEAKMKRLSYHDKLTGLYNRAYFEEKLKAIDDESQLPISIIIADMNGLKLANDAFGHHEGDKLLVHAADILKNSARAEDIVARYGGDEFIILMPKASQELAAEICTNIMNLCRKTHKDIIPTSISIGYAIKERKEKSIVSTIKEAESMMYKHKFKESEKMRNAMITSLEKTLFKNDFESRKHTIRLIETTNEFGKRLGLSQTELGHLDLLSRLHDIGKVTIDEHILNKKGSLTEEEFLEVKKHPEAGYRIATSSQILTNISRYILHHHERWDGKGYPHGLKEDEIPLLSRILAIADSYDAMTNDRPYRKAMSQETALEELKKCAGTQFDPELVPIFVSIIQNSYNQL